jgi:Tfp pilus assembly protein PilF
LKGRYFYGKMSEDALRKSVAYFKSALEADPHFALAYAGLADTYTLFAFLDLMPAAEAMPQARDLAETALQIDPQLAEAHASLAGIKKLFEWDWAASEAEYRRALQLNPNLASAHHWYADHLSALGRFEEAISEIRRAHELDPLSLVINNEVAWNLYMARDFESALQEAWRTLALEPRFAPAQHTLGLANEQLGNLEEAIVEFQNSCVCSGNHPGALAALAHAHAVSGATGEALTILHDLNEISKRRHVSPYWLSLVYTALGDHGAAFDLLNRAIEERDVWMVWLNVEPRFDPLRTDGRFKDLLRTLGLPRA